MINIVFLVPLESLVDLVKSVLAEHNRHTQTTPEYGFDFSVFVAKNYRSIPREALDADVFIARGLITEELKRLHPWTTVVEVPIGYEMVATIMEAVKRHGNLPVAVIGSFNMVYASHGIGDVLEIDLKQYIQESNEDYMIKRDLDRIEADGKRIIITGPVTYEWAVKRDCYPFVLGMSKNSIWDALTRAKRLGMVRRREREKAAQFQSLLNSAHEGIIITDLDGRVTTVNTAAASILGVSPLAAIGSAISALLPVEKETEMFCDLDYSGRMIDLNGERLLVNKGTVALGGRRLGNVFTLLIAG